MSYLIKSLLFEVQDGPRAPRLPNFKLSASFETTDLVLDLHYFHFTDDMSLEHEMTEWKMARRELAANVKGTTAQVFITEPQEKSISIP